MSSDINRIDAAPPAMTIAPNETTTSVAPSDPLAVADTSSPVLAEPEMLVEGLRYLQQRIPEFSHLSLEEKRSHARAANLDPGFIESGLQAAEVWRHRRMSSSSRLSSSASRFSTVFVYES